MKQADRNTVIKNAFDAGEELTLTRSSYRDTVYSAFARLADEDIDSGDVSLTPLQSYNKNLSARIVAKSPTFIAGLEEIQFFCSLRGLTVTTDYKNGDKIEADKELLKIEGPATQILSLERTILNVLQRLSGIASTTQEFVGQIVGIDSFVVGTRKTLWGLLDKRAIQCGGGLTHRLGLHDAAMLKENHLAILRESNNPESLKNAVTEIIAAYPYLRFIEIEVTTNNEYREMLGYLENITAPFPFVIMFDHFESNDIAHLVTEAKKKKLYNHLLFEASGNITMETIRDYAISGVDVISVGALTHSVKSADFSLLIEKQ